MSNRPASSDGWVYDSPTPSQASSQAATPVTRSDTVSPSVPAVATAPSRDWFKIALICALAFFVVREIRSNPSPSPNDDTVIVDVTGDFALVLVDDERQDDLSAGQASAINWAGAIEYAKEQEIDVRRYDAKITREQLSKLEPAVQLLFEKADPPPSLTIVRDGKLITGPVPSGINAYKEALRK